MSLSTKLGLAMGGGVLLACLFVTVGVVLRAVEAQGTAREHEIRAYAQVLAASLSEVMDADGHADLYRRLSSIRDARGVGFAEVVDTRGQRIAHVGMQAVLLDTGEDWASYFPALGDLLRARTLVAEAAIRRSGETVGLVRLAGEAPGAGEALNREFRSAAAWALFALMFGALCSFLLQRRIVDPIRQLTTRMSAAERRGALPGALTMSGTGEIGVLVTAYNRMIGEIAIRDEELGQHRLHLENLVDERTAELRAARDEAEQATEAKSRFLATMSHEIRTPMNGLLVMAEMLERTRLPASSKTYVSTIARCGRSMMDILNDILDFSKLEAERLELESIPFSPDDLANDVLRLFWEQARSKGIELTGFIAPDVPAQLLGDPTRLRQCISNLVGNAIKFTETGHVSLNIERAGETLSIAVCDTGAGIPQDRLSTIFQAFTQADQSTTRRHGGTGLGLNIAAQLVAAMGGEIGVESTIGEGSTFCMTLPCLESTPAASRGAMPPVLLVTTSQPALGAALGRAFGVRGIGTKGAPAAIFVDADAPGEAMPGVPRIGIWDFGCEPPMAALADGRLQDILPLPYTRAELDALLARIETGTLRGTAAISTEAEASDALAAFEGLRVLVADDSPLNHDVMIEALGALGIEPTLVSDGRAALDAIATGAFDFAFIDGEMPELDGFSVAAEARRLGTTTRLILFSAHTVGVTVGKEAMDCFDGVLTKPFGLSQLESVLRDGNAQETERVAAPAADSESPTGSVFDAALMAQLDRLDERRPGAKLRVLDTFATALPTAIEALREALASGCRDESRKNAHALKSISLSAGAERIGKAAAALENRLSAGDVPQAESDAILATLMAERDAALAELARMQVAQAA